MASKDRELDNGNSGLGANVGESDGIANEFVERVEIIEQPTKSKRGRKSGSGNNGGNPTSTGTATSRAKSKKTLVIDRAKFAKQVVGAHAFAAHLFTSQLLLIDDREGELLANSLVDVMEQYDLSINPKISAWVGLLAASAMVYGPRVIMLNKMKQAEAQQRAAAARENMTVAGMPVN